MISILFRIFILSFLLNLLWEVSHSVLYKTCLKLSLKKYVPLMIKTSFKDGLLIIVIYLITIFMFNNINIINNYLQLSIFVVFSLILCYINEIVSIKYKRWEYADNMPKLLGVGITPLIQIAITGILTFLFVFLI